MTRGGGFRPAGQVATFLTCSFANNAGQIAITYTTSGFLAGFNVVFWAYGATGLPVKVGSNPTGTLTNVNIGLASGIPSTVWAVITDNVGELCARSAYAIL